jgi:adenine-specific DNA methylase
MSQENANTETTIQNLLFPDSGIGNTPTKKPRKRKAADSNPALNSHLPPNLGKPIKVATPDFSNPDRPRSCLEVDFPLVPINALSALEGNAGKPIYQMSKWWARRRSCVFRALLLAAAMEAPTRKHPDGQPMIGPDGKPIIDEDAAAQMVWDAYYANHQAAGNFKDLKVLDPFMGGGTTLVEGSRLGFQVAGVDLNPVAWFIVKNELACTDPEEVRAFFDQIEAEVKPQIQPFYVTDGVGGRKGTWFKVGVDGRREKMSDDFDPIKLPYNERKEYQYEGPEVIYTFWAKHGPCTKPGCGHRTPIFRSPIVATKQLRVKYIECTCKACKTVFHAELGDARIAPDAEHVVLENEQPYTVVSPGFAKRLLAYDEGRKEDKNRRIAELSELVETEVGFNCPRCGAWSGQTVRDVLASHVHAERMSDIKKKHLGIVPARNSKKPIYCTLLIDPEWLKGAPGQLPDGTESGGYIDAPIEATAAWYRERLKSLKLIEVRGMVGDAPVEDTDEDTALNTETEDTEEAENEKTWLPASITLKDGRTVDTTLGTVPKRSTFTCQSCGQQSDLLDAVKMYTNRTRMETQDSTAQRSLPVTVYAIQCFDRQRDADGHPYGGRYFKTPDEADVERLLGAEREWTSRREVDLKDYWPRSILPHTWMTHHLNGGIPNWGFTHWYKMFNTRQLVLHATLLRAIATIERVNDAVRDQAIGAFQQYLRMQNMFVFWHEAYDKIAPHLSNPHFHPKARVVENNFSGAIGYGKWSSCTETVLSGLTWALAPNEKIAARDQDAAKSEAVALADAVLPGSNPVNASSTEMDAKWTAIYDNVITDPPFGDNLFYGDLSNFFYVWLRLALKYRYPEQFGPEFVPRSQEAVADRSRFPNADTDEEAAMSAANAAYQSLMTACWSESRRVMKDGGIMAFTFHHSADEPWMSILQSLFDSGWLLEATYPIRSDETKGEGGQFGSRKIEYDIIHVCRKRLEEPKAVSWPKMRQWVKAELSRLRPLLESYKNRGLQDADVRVILRGKALEFYSRHYGKVLVSVPGGEDTVLSIRDALLGINQLLDESSSEPGERPPSIVQPVVYQYLRLFGQKARHSRDEVSKLLRGTAIQQKDFEKIGSTPWIMDEDRVIRRVPIYDRFQKMVKRSRRELKTELDQAHFLIGAAGISLQLLRAAFEAKRARMRREDPMLFEEWEASIQTVE